MKWFFSVNVANLLPPFALDRYHWHALPLLGNFGLNQLNWQFSSSFSSRLRSIKSRCCRWSVGLRPGFIFAAIDELVVIPNSSTSHLYLVILVPFWKISFLAWTRKKPMIQRTCISKLPPSSLTYCSHFPLGECWLREQLKFISFFINSITFVDFSTNNK